MNLTRVPESVAVERHLFDSAAILPEIDEAGASQIIDIGTGAGLPGVVIAILRPNVQVTMVESIKKKAGFVSSVISELNLPNAVVVAERAEAIGKLKSFAGRFDVVTARAVASVKDLIAWCAPFKAKSGIMLFQKGPKLPDELRDAEKLMRSQNLKKSTREYTVSGEAFSVLKLWSGVTS
jgi:16S rRNA (guanine527-N7)-methyltransferase